MTSCSLSRGPTIVETTTLNWIKDGKVRLRQTRGPTTSRKSALNDGTRKSNKDIFREGDRLIAACCFVELDDLVDLVQLTAIRGEVLRNKREGRALAKRNSPQ